MQTNGYNEFLDQLRAKCNIVDVVGRYVKLDRKGATYWACCPFHNEKTPSFAVNESKGFYNCFGCHEHGDVFSFVMKLEGVPFMDAVKILAERVGMKVPDFSPTKDDYFKQKKERLYALVRDAAVHYNTNIRQPQNELPRNYLVKRQLSRKTATDFGIGYSVGYRELPQYLKKLGYTEEEMVDAGVCDIKDGKIYDALANRLIVPIINNMGKVIAFGGRMLKDSDFAKYKNTKETQLFEKRKELFGFPILKAAKMEGRLKSIIVVEGYMDVISLYQAGFDNVCASMGTALTPEQCKTIKFYSDNIYLCYDGDGAGQKAANRGIDVLRECGMSAKIITLPEGLDPDDVIKKYGHDKFVELIEQAIPPMDYKLRALAKKYDMSQAEQRGKFALDGINMLTELNSLVEQEAYLPIVADMSGLSIDTIVAQFNKSASIKSTRPDKPKVPVRRQTASVERYYKSSRCLLKLIYANNYEIKEDLVAYLIDKQHIALYNNARALLSVGTPLSLDMLSDSDGEVEKIASTQIVFDTELALSKLVEDSIRALKKGYYQMRLDEMKEDSATCDGEERREIWKKIQEINTLMKELD